MSKYKILNLPHFNIFCRKFNTFRLQYVSDLHIDTHKTLPKINPSSKYLAICGDIGQPYASRYTEFIYQQSNNFEKVFFVPGNHDFDLGTMYKKNKVDKWEPFIKEICHKFENVIYLNRHIYELDNDIIIAGSILWSNPILDTQKLCTAKYLEHINEHNKHVNWIKNITKQNKNKKIIMLTHFVPTFQLIEQKYLNKGFNKTTWFATDLEYLIKSPIKAWICGHTHSIMSCKINDVQCAVNAYGYGRENGYKNKNIDKILEI